MKRSAILLFVGLLIAWHGAASHAIDQVRTTSNDTVIGTIKSMSPVTVVVEQRNGTNREVPAGEIESISFDQEPAVLKTARANSGSGRYEDALEALAGLNTAEIERREIVQDIDYYKAYCSAQMALVRTGDMDDIKGAGKMVRAFMTAHKNSYHYLDAQMLYGDLAGAIGSPQAAQSVYQTVVDNAPWPEYKARAAVALGRSYLAAKQIPQASAAFKIALDMPDTALGVQPHKLAATLGDARCMAASGKLEPAIEKVETVIRQADSDDSQLLAEAYNALGASYRASKRSKDALLAYLNVHLVYFNSRQNHIEALENLVELWNEQHMPERANEAVGVLRDRYKRSPR